MSPSRSPAPRRPRSVRRAEWRTPTSWLRNLALALALLRLVGLGRNGLWIDEAFTLHDSLALGAEGVSRFPLGLAMMRAWLATTGLPASETVLRLPAAVLGAATIPLTAWAFRPLIGERRAWIAAALLGLSSWHLYWSQSARAYTLMLALSLLGAGLALRGCIEAKPRRYVAGLVCAGLATFAHPTGALVAGALVLAPSIARSETFGLSWSPPRWMGAFALAAAGALAPWALAVWSDYSWRKPGWSLAHLALSTGFYVTVPVGLAAAYAAWRAWREKMRGERLASVIVLLGLGGLAVAACMAKVAAQYAFVLAPWIVALAAAALDETALKPAIARTLGLACLAWGAFEIVAYSTVRHGDRPRWRDAYEFVAQRRGAEDLVCGMAAPVGGYYLAPGEPFVRSTSALLPLTRYGWEELVYWIASERRIWIVLNREDLAAWPQAERAEFERFLREQCQSLRTFEVGATPRDLDVEVLVRN